MLAAFMPLLFFNSHSDAGILTRTVYMRTGGSVKSEDLLKTTELVEGSGFKFRPSDIL